MRRNLLARDKGLSGISARLLPLRSFLPPPPPLQSSPALYSTSHFNVAFPPPPISPSLQSCPPTYHPPKWASLWLFPPSEDGLGVPRPGCAFVV